MKTIKAIQSFSVNGIYYEKGDEVEVTNLKDLVVMNEKGFIEPLTAKDLQNFKKEINKKPIIKISKKEEE